MSKYSVITGSLNNICDRYMSGGYKRPYTYEELIIGLKAVNVDELKGVELSYSTQGGIESNKDDILPLLAKYNMKPSFVNSSLFGEKKWSNGSLSSSDKTIRQNAIDDCKQAIDFTMDIEADGFNLWTGQDGFDYPLQTDYKSQWDNFLDSVGQLCEHASKTRITLEPKLREPRNRSLIDTVPTALLACQELGKDNLGLTIDVGHTLQAGGNIARDLDMAIRSNRLFNVHINDNYASWDDDMIVGSVHMIEFIEMMYVLKLRGYEEWISVDIFPFREDQFEAVRECILYLESFGSVVDSIGMDKFTGLIAKGSTTETMKVIREFLFQGIKS